MASLLSHLLSFKEGGALSHAQRLSHGCTERIPLRSGDTLTYLASDGNVGEKRFPLIASPTASASASSIRARRRS